MDTAQDRLLLTCSFCRNYTTTTTTTATMSSTPPPTTTTTPCESYQPSTTCQSCVRLYEGLTPHLSSCAMENVGKTQNNPSPLSRFHSTGKITFSSFGFMALVKFSGTWLKMMTSSNLN